MKKIFLFTVVFFLIGCSTHINYTPNKMNIEEAIDIADELIMTQHELWRPEGFGVNEKYISLGFGSVTNSITNRGLLGLNSKSITKGAGERIYYKHIDRIEMIKWLRKFQRWYVISLYSNEGRLNKHLFYSRNKKDAELFFDSLYTIVNHPYEIEFVSPQPENLNIYH